MHPYAGQRAALATMHGKERAIAAPLQTVIGLSVMAAPEVDTDQFGTFAGEIPRRGSMRDAALAKARAGMAKTGARLGLASEGSFGPHPLIPFVAAGQELIVLVDDERDIVIAESATSERCNFDHVVVDPGDDLAPFLTRIGFPDHAVIVRPSAVEGMIAKGVTDFSALRHLVTTLSAISPDGKARIETDMRAYLNPTRMAEIAALAGRFAGRLASLCPACQAPGFGPVRTEPGLPCADCGAATALAHTIIHGCAACAHETQWPRPDGRSHATPAECPECNP